MGGKKQSQELLKDILESQAYAVTLFPGYNALYETSIPQNPDLILFSIDCPESKIFSHFKKIKKTKELQDVPVIITGIFRDQSIKIKYFQAGCADYIDTPFHLEEVLCRVQTHVSLHRTQKQLKSQLANKSVDLSAKTKELEETVIALKVLLKHHEEDKKKLELTMLDNLSLLIEPTLEKLKNSSLNDIQRAYFEILTSNLKHITSPLLKGTDAKYRQLTPSEIQIANLIKNGKTTKEIADLLHLSVLTIATHRKNIRKKVGLTKKKQNLHSFLR